MTPERQREISSMGGKAAHKNKTAHEWTSEQARIAGRKGGMASRRKLAPGEFCKTHKATGKVRGCGRCGSVINVDGKIQHPL